MRLEVLAKILAAGFLAIFLLHKVRRSPETRYGFQDRVRNTAKKALKNSPNIFTSASLCFAFLMILSLTLMGNIHDFSAHVSISGTQECEQCPLKIDLGDTLRVDVALKYPKAYTVDPDLLTGHLLQHMLLAPPPFLLKDRKINTQELADGITSQNLSFILEPQTVGTYTLSLYTIPFTKKGEDPIELTSERFTVKVTPPLVTALPKIMPPFSRLSEKPPIGISENNQMQLIAQAQKESRQNVEILATRTFPWHKIGWTAFFATFVAIIAWILRKQKMPFKKQVSPKTVALRHLKAIDAKKLPEKEKFEEFYTQITDMIRFYIENQYGVRAPTSTTQEFLHEMTANPVFGPNTQKTLTQFLYHADKVKFAEEIPSLDECQKARDAAEQVLKNGAD